MLPRLGLLAAISAKLFFGSQRASAVHAHCEATVKPRMPSCELV